MGFQTLIVVPRGKTRIRAPFVISTKSLWGDRLSMQIPRARVAENEEVGIIHPVLLMSSLGESIVTDLVIKRPL